MDDDTEDEVPLVVLVIEFAVVAVAEVAAADDNAANLAVVGVVAEAELEADVERDEVMDAPDVLTVDSPLAASGTETTYIIMTLLRISNKR